MIFRLSLVLVVGYVKKKQLYIAKKKEGGGNGYFKKDLGWFSVFMLIGFSFYQQQIGFTDTSSNANVCLSACQFTVLTSPNQAKMPDC